MPFYTTAQDRDRAVLSCDCAGECTQILLMWDEEYGVLYLSPRPEKLCWRERLRRAWHLLVAGEPWPDSMILGRETVRALTEWIAEREASRGKG